MINSRNIGLDHGAGKGDADRSDRKKFASNFPTGLTGNVDGFEKRGGRLVKVYGPRAHGAKLRIVDGTGIKLLDLAKVDKDAAMAQGLANEQNAAFRAQGFDTKGY